MALILCRKRKPQLTPVALTTQFENHCALTKQQITCITVSMVCFIQIVSLTLKTRGHSSSRYMQIHFTYKYTGSCNHNHNNLVQI